MWADKLSLNGNFTDDGVSAFPYGMPLPRDEEAEFREKLRYMDSSTRGMFIKMARLFSNKKKKKTARQMYVFLIVEILTH